MSVRVQDNGASRLLRELRRRATVRVGVQPRDQSREHVKSGLTVGEIAERHEFGLGVPTRSWLRGWMIKRQAEIESRLAAAAQSVVDGVRTLDQAARIFAEWAEEDIRERIQARIPPPNAASTLRRKRGDVPLIDSGQLLRAITARVLNRGS